MDILGKVAVFKTNRMVAVTSHSVVLSAVFHQICLCQWLHYCHSAEKVNRATWGTRIKNKKEEKTIAATQKNLSRTEPNSNSFLTTKYRFSLQKIQCYVTLRCYLEIVIIMTSGCWWQVKWCKGTNEIRNDNKHYLHNHTFTKSIAKVN